MSAWFTHFRAHFPHCILCGFLDQEVTAAGAGDVVVLVTRLSGFWQEIWDKERFVWEMLRTRLVTSFLDCRKLEGSELALIRLVEPKLVWCKPMGSELVWFK